MEKSQNEYPKARNTVDVVALADEKKVLHVLLIKRGKEPFKGMWALPGGHIEVKESPYHAAMRELKEETGLSVDELHPLGSFNIEDPRGWTISAGYMCLTEGIEDVVAGDDAIEAQWFPIKSLPNLAFGHKWLIMAAVEDYGNFE